MSRRYTLAQLFTFKGTILLQKLKSQILIKICITMNEHNIWLWIFILLFYCASYRLNMFRGLLWPSSGARNYDVGYHVSRFVLGLL
jgi:hypothetical protein